MSKPTHNAAQVAAEHQGHIKALRAYLARTGYAPAVIDPAVAEAIATLVNRPDISRPMAFLTTIARGEAERLTAEMEARDEQPLSAPDLIAAMREPVKKATRRRSRRTPPTRQRVETTDPQGRLV